MTNFDKIANIYDSFFIQFYYAWAHRKSIKFLKNYIKDNSRILDVGCATGNFLRNLKKSNNTLNLFGIDESEKMIKIAQKKFKNINFIFGKAENLPFKNNNFGLITIIDAFYYFKDKEKVISECYRTLNSNGYLFIFTPTVDHFLSRFLLKLSKLFLRLIKLYKTREDSKHLYFNEIKVLAENFGFKLIKKDLKFWQWLLLFQKQ